MPQGASAYVYVAYADDASGNGFSLTDPDHDYVAILTSTTPIISPTAANFTGLWHKWTGPAGIDGALSRRWSFSTNTSSSDPTNGFVKLNNADATLVTSIYISEVDDTTANVAAILAVAAASSSTVKSYIQVTKSDDNSKFATYSVSGLTDNGTWDTVAVTYVSGSGSAPFALNDQVTVSISRTGDQGIPGAAGGTGVIVLINDLTQQASNTAVGTDAFTWSIPANTMVNDMDICELEIDVYSPIDTGGGDSQLLQLIDSEGVSWAFWLPAGAGWQYSHHRVTVSRVSATSYLETQRQSNGGTTLDIMYNELRSGGFDFTTDALDITLNVINNHISASPAPYATIQRATLKYFPKV